MTATERLISMEDGGGMADDRVNHRLHRYPHCIVWTPIPLISWLFPFVGHMGIGTSSGVIRDFAGSYYVSEDDMGFGWPTLFWQLDMSKVPGGSHSWDRAVADASDEYKNHAHNIFCDNCHSHVAMALNDMQYAKRTNWNMVLLAAAIIFKGRYVSCGGFLKQWLPFTVIVALLAIFLIVAPAAF